MTFHSPSPHLELYKCINGSCIVKKIPFFLILLISFFISAEASVKFHFVYKQNEISNREAYFQNIVKTALKLDNEETLYYQAVVKVYATEQNYADYLVADLYRKDCYLIEPVRLDLKGDSVIAITYDYVEEVEPEPIPCNACPDPEVEFVISYIEDALFPGAIEHGWGTWAKMTTQWGINAALVIGINETKETMLGYLSCPKLVGWGRIGHGLKDAIQFNKWTQKLTANEVIQYKDLLKDKIFIFNSCLSHNDPFESAMMEAGVKFFAAGDISLSGKKEFVFSEFFINAIQSNMELSNAMQQAQIDYPDAWGWSSPKNGQLYFSLDMTDNLENFLNNNNSFSVITNSNFVQFSGFKPNQLMNLSIYDLSGKKIYSSSTNSDKFIWNMSNANGNNIASGTYMAVIKNQNNQTNTIKKINISKK